MEAIIIGHGPSVLKKLYGSYIDSFDYVIRQKANSIKYVKENPEQYGTKTYAIGGSTGQYQAISQIKNIQRWVYIDSRRDPQKNYDLQYDNEGLNVKCNQSLCHHWNQIFRDMRTDNWERNPQEAQVYSDPKLGHNHMSSGTHTILYTCHYLRPSKVHLLGYDNVRSGKFGWSITRGKDWKNYGDHRYDVEQKMLPLFEKEFNTKIVFVE